VGDFVGSDVTSLSVSIMGLAEGITDDNRLGYEDGALLICKPISWENALSESRIKIVKSTMLVMK